MQDDLTGLWVEHGGDTGSGTSGTLVVLLHGMGATGAVWGRMTPLIAARGLRWIAPDLRGHGASAQAGNALGGPFGLGQHAADIAALIEREAAQSVILLGHSFGGAVAALVAGGLFDVAPTRVVALGVKTDWPTADIDGALALAAKPARVFDTAAAAQERYLKVSGLHGLVSADDPLAARGIQPVAGGYSLSMDPRVSRAVSTGSATGVTGLLATTLCPLHLSAGTNDPMVNAETLRALDPGCTLIAGAPHNAHVTHPQAVVALLDRVDAP